MRVFWLDDETPIPLEYLVAHGIGYQALSTESAEYQGPLDTLKADNGYVQQDLVEMRPDTPGLEALCEKFAREHTHDHDEVRFVLEGEGIFDIRDDDDRWMRCVVDPGDLVVVPHGRNHRFLLTESRHIRCVRLFQDEAGWVPRYRQAG